MKMARPITEPGCPHDLRHTVSVWRLSAGTLVGAGVIVSKRPNRGTRNREMPVLAMTAASGWLRL